MQVARSVEDLLLLLRDDLSVDQAHTPARRQQQARPPACALQTCWASRPCSLWVLTHCVALRPCLQVHMHEFAFVNMRPDRRCCNKGEEAASHHTTARTRVASCRGPRPMPSCMLHDGRLYRLHDQNGRGLTREPQSNQTVVQSNLRRPGLLVLARSAHWGGQACTDREHERITQRRRWPLFFQPSPPLGPSVSNQQSAAGPPSGLPSSKS